MDSTSDTTRFAKRRFDVLAFAALSAMCFALAFPPFDVWPLVFVAIAPLTWAAMCAPSTRMAVFATLITQFVMWLWLYRWLINVTEAGYPVLCAYMSIYPALFVWIVRRARSGARTARVPMTLAVPVIWVGMEFLRGSVAFNGYPWYFLGHPVVNALALVQSADLLGTYFISFLAAMFSGAIVEAALVLREKRGMRSALRPITLVCVVLPVNALYGVWRLSQTDSLSDGPNILAIQTNLPQDNKVGWSPQEQIEDFGRFARLTIESVEQARARGERIDLVAWPETMLPGFGLEPDTLRMLAEGGYVPGDAFARGIEQVREFVGAPMLIGSPAYFGLRVENEEWAWDTQYNSAYLLQGRPPYQRYDKFFLTPFGETMPYISSWKWLEQKLLALGARGMKFELSSNPNLRVLELQVPDEALFVESQDAAIATQPAERFHLATPICFEDTVPAVCRKMVYPDGRKHADVLVNLSNEGWFADFDSERTLHAHIARLRCIENRVPMVRVANTGMTMSIDSAGRVIGKVGDGEYGTPREPGSLLAKTQIDSRQTLFGRIGDAWGWVCLIATLLGLILAWRRPTQPTAN